MKGLELSKAYFEEYGRALIEGQPEEYRGKLAAGLVGEGSECFGYDDEFSQDHDFGPSFCIWMPQQLYNEIGTAIQVAYEQLPKEYRGYRRIQSAQGGGRVGAMTIEGFYLKYTGLTYAPKDNMEWFRIPERFLATAINGQVFYDPSGMFSQIRSELMKFYPEDVLKKKLAARAVIMAQAGQYNYPRCAKRGDFYAAYLACGEFVHTALSAIFLLNQQYMPFYKWAFRKAEELTLCKDALADLRKLVMLGDNEGTSRRKEALIENVCVGVGKEFNRRGYTLTTESFLQSHGQELMRSISDSRLRGLNIMADCD